MAKYSLEFKEKVVLRLMPPNAESVAQVHRDTGVSEATLYLWRNEYRNKGMAVPADPSNPENWLELTRFGGHLITFAGGVHHAEDKTAVFP